MLKFFGCIIALLIILFFISLLFPMFFARCVVRMMGINPNDLQRKASNQSNANSAEATSRNNTSTSSSRAGNAHHEFNERGGTQNGEKIFRSDEGQYVDYEDVDDEDEDF